MGPLRQKLVVEVQFEPFTGGRFRHGTRFFGWRPEKEGRDHTFQPVERETRSVLGSAVIASCWRSAQPDIKTTNERRRAIEP